MKREHRHAIPMTRNAIKTAAMIGRSAASERPWRKVTAAPKDAPVDVDLGLAVQG